MSNTQKTFTGTVQPGQIRPRGDSMSAENREEFEQVVEPAAAEPAEPAVEAEPAPADIPAEPEEPAEDPVKKEKGIQKRINELTREKHEARAEAEYYRKLAEQAQPSQPQDDFIPPGFPAEPVLDQFEDYDQYNRALVRWEANRILAERDHKAEQGKAQAAKQTVMQAHAARVEAVQEKYTDFDEAIASAPDISFNDGTFSAIVESDQSADIVYHLAKNPAEAYRLHGLSPVQQIKEIARLEDKFSAAPEKPVKRVSQAPTPINALNGTSEAAASSKEPDAALNPAAWSAWEAARVKKLGRRY